MDKKEELQGLTLARFFAAFAVVLMHTWQDLGAVPALLERFFRSGYTCVAFFFVLSGFVLVYAAHGRAFEVRAFLVRRVARLWPVYLVGWALFGVTVLAEGANLGTWVAGGLTFAGLQSWLPGMAFRWNMPAWSLSTEAFFYLSFPYLYRRLLTVSDRTLWYVLIGAVLANTLHLYVVRVPPEWFAGTPFNGRWSWETFASCLPIFRVPQFIAGMVLGLLFLRHRKALPWLLPASLIASLALWLVPNELPVPRDILLLVTYGALIYSLAWVKTASGFGLLLGRASYSLYILHWPLWALWSPFMPPSPVRLVTFCVLAITASLVAYHWIERPAEKWIKDRWAKRPAIPIAVLA